MRLIIDHHDFQRLSRRTQRELVDYLGGKRVVDLRSAAKSPANQVRPPVDLTPDLAARLLHGLADNHRRRLELFAKHGPRVTMKQLLAVTGDEDLRVLSYFQGAVTRKLRRLMHDRDPKPSLMEWDYASTKWDKDHKTIVDGVYYVSRKTARALKRCFDNP